MSEQELKPCPFCGSNARGVTPESKSVWCINRECENHSASWSREAWNTRPIEDALAAENAALKEKVAEMEANNARIYKAISRILHRCLGRISGLQDYKKSPE